MYMARIVLRPRNGHSGGLFFGLITIVKARRAARDEMQHRAEVISDIFTFSSGARARSKFGRGAAAPMRELPGVAEARLCDASC